MSHTPLHLTARDFDAYAPEKATSNAYSRPRLEVKQRALAWARSVVARLAEVGISVDVHGSDEHPTLRNRKRVDCQWMFFSRDASAREELERLLDRGRSIAEVIDDPSPFRRHAFLALRIDVEGIEVCFAVHPEARVDVDNLRARVTSTSDELLRAVAGLPEQFSITLGDPAPGSAPQERVSASTISLEALRGLVDRVAEGQVPLRVGWSVGREAAIEHSAENLGDEPGRGPTVDEQLEDAIVALAPLYRLVAWSRDNDLIALDRRIENAEEDRARAHAEAQAETERWRLERAEARRRAAEENRARSPAVASFPSSGPRSGKPSLGSLFGKPAKPRSSAPAPAASPPAAAPNVAVASVVLTPSEAPPKGPAVAASPASPASHAPLIVDKGAKVRVLSGPFADKIGTVGELDGRGGARVLLGLLSTRIDVAGLELVVEGRERPPLQSSHRRRPAPAPRRAR